MAQYHQDYSSTTSSDDTGSETELTGAFSPTAADHSHTQPPLLELLNGGITLPGGAHPWLEHVHGEWEYQPYSKPASSYHDEHSSWGLRKSPTGPLAPLECLQLVLPDQFVTWLGQHCTAWYHRTHGKDLKWTNNDFWCFIGAWLRLGGYFKIPNEASAWLTDPLRGDPLVPLLISRDRFLELKRALHAYEREDEGVHAPEESTQPADSMQAELLERWNWNQGLLVVPGSHISVDESMSGWIVRSGRKHYVPAKPRKSDLKFYVAADPKSGMPYSLTCYSEQRAMVPMGTIVRLLQHEVSVVVDGHSYEAVRGQYPTAFTSGEASSADLNEIILGLLWPTGVKVTESNVIVSSKARSGVKIYMGKEFMTLQRLAELQRHNVSCTGMVLFDRLPAELKSFYSKNGLTKPNAVPLGTVLMWRERWGGRGDSSTAQPIMVASWRDSGSKLVHLLSSEYVERKTVQVQRCTKGSATRGARRSTFIGFEAYAHNMAGVHLLDQRLMAAFGRGRRNSRLASTVLFYVLRASTVSAYLIFCKYGPSKTAPTVGDFIAMLVGDILERYTARSRPPRAMRPLHSVAHTVSDHTVSDHAHHLGFLEHQAKCAMCPKMTTNYCISCAMPLCHTKKHSCFSEAHGYPNPPTVLEHLPGVKRPRSASL